MADETLTPAEIQAAEELAKAQKELAWQLTSVGVNAATIIDPTGLSNIPAMGMSLYEGDFIGAGLSLIGLIPLAGKLGDVAKEARLAERLAAMGEKVAALTAKLNKVRKEANAAREAARLAKAGKEAKEAEAVSKTAESAVKEAKAVPHEAPPRCIPCEKATAEKAAAEKVAVEKAAHQETLGKDPATKQFRSNEAETATRIETKEGVTLERYQPKSPSQKGDWIDPATGTVYDGCSPPKSQFFDLQLDKNNYQNSLIEHVNHPNVDRVVIDTSGLELTTQQSARLDNLIKSLTPAQRAKLLLLP